MLKAHIVATTETGLIGLDNTLPWGHCKEDLRLFKAITLNHVVAMGYNTVLSLPKKLPRRLTYAVLDIRTKSPTTDLVGIYEKANKIVYNVAGFIDDIKIPEEYEKDLIFIAGGAKLYAQTMDEIDLVYRNVLCNIKIPDTEGKVEHYYPVDVLQKDFHCVSEHYHGDAARVRFYIREELWMRKK